MGRLPTIRTYAMSAFESSLAWVITAFVLFALAASLGCRGRSWLPPAGTMSEQQARAVIHDPYPQNDIAPGDLGSRPPSYQEPLPEPVRNRIVPDAMPWLGR